MSNKIAFYLLAFTVFVLISGSQTAGAQQESTTKPSSRKKSFLPRKSQTPLKSTQASPVNNPPPPVESSEPSTWAGGVTALYGRSLFDKGDGSRYDGINYIVTFKYSFNKDYSLGFKSGYSQNLNNPSRDDFSDTSLSVNRANIVLSPYLVLAPSLTGFGPTSRYSREVLDFMGGARLRLVFSLNPEINPNLTLSASFSGGQNFYEYSTDVNGLILNKTTLTEIYTLGYKWGDLSLSAYYAHRQGWTHKNTTNQAYEISEELNYDLNKNWTITLGHTNGGAALNANGQDANVSIVNEDSSIVYGGFTLNF